MAHSTGFIEVDMFPPEIDSPDHPEAVRLRALLEDVAEEYDCRLLSYEVRSGTVVFSFDSEELMAEILGILRHDGESAS